MPVYNAEAYIANAIESILSQSFEDFELVIINDGSNDRTRDVLSDYAVKDSRILIMDQENRGYICAMNVGLAVCGGEYIARMDADDVSMTTRFERQVTFLDTHPNVAVVGSAFWNIDDKGKKCGVPIYHPCSHESICDELEKGRSPIRHPAAMMRRVCIERMRGYRECLMGAEDYDLWLRLREHYELANVPDVLLFQRIHSSSVSVKYVREQALSVYAALHAARLRQTGHEDPLGPATEMSSEVLGRLNISEEMISYIQQRAVLNCAKKMLKINRPDQADAYLRQLAKNIDDKKACDDLSTDYNLVKTRLLFKKNQPVKALKHIIMAVIIQPRSLVYSAHKLIDWLRTRIRPMGNINH